MRNTNLTRGRRIAIANAIRETLRLSNWHDAAARAGGHAEHRGAATAASQFAAQATDLARQVNPDSLDEFIAEIAAANELLSDANPTRDLVDSVRLRTRHANVVIQLASPHR